MPAPPLLPAASDDSNLRELVARCRHHDPAAQRTLYERFAGPMMAVCRRYAPTLPDAEDALQDAFVKVFERITSFREQGSLEGWIRRIVVGTAIDAWHRHRVRRVDFGLDDVHHLPDPDAAILDRIALAEVRALIDRLPDGCRLVLLLYTVEGYSHAEVGQLLGISETASKVQLTRARQRLTALVRSQERSALSSSAGALAPPGLGEVAFNPLTSLLFQ